MLSYEVDDDNGWNNIDWKVIVRMDIFKPDRDNHSWWWTFNKAVPVNVITKNR